MPARIVRGTQMGLTQIDSWKITLVGIAAMIVTVLILAIIDAGPIVDSMS
jgi:hypothetical protein